VQPRLLGRVGRVQAALGLGRCTGIGKDRGICWILECKNLITSVIPFYLESTGSELCTGEKTEEPGYPKLKWIKVH